MSRGAVGPRRRRGRDAEADAHTESPVRVFEVPELARCPGCGLDLQPGGGPHGLAWHECRPPAKSAAAVVDLVLARIAEVVPGANAPELAILLKALHEFQGKPKRRAGSNGPTEDEGAVADWLTRGGTAASDAGD